MEGGDVGTLVAIIKKYDNVYDNGVQLKFNWMFLVDVFSSKRKNNHG